MLVSAIILIFATAVAIFSANFLVKGAITVAQAFNIPQFIIGAFIIGFGTSLPELFINVEAAQHGNTDLALTNILGSNLFNLCFSLGLLGLIGRLDVGNDVRLKDAPMYLIAALMIAVCGNQLYLDHINYHELMMSHGIIFLCFFSIYIYYTLLSVKQQAPHTHSIHGGIHKTFSEKKQSQPIFKALLLVCIGLVGLIIAGEWIVDSAQNIAKLAGLSDKLIGLLIIGPGTSLPEFVACLLALRQKSTALIIGNIIGSNLFNIFFTLGITAMILPIPLDFALNQVVVLNIVAAAILACTFWFFPANKLNKFTAFLLFAIYILYVYLVLQ